MRIQTKRVLLFFLFVFLHAKEAEADRKSDLERKLQSVSACQESIKHKNCNLKTLSPELRKALIDLEKLKEQRLNLLPREPDVSAIQGQVQFFVDEVSRVDDNIFELRGGSKWEVDGFVRPSLASSAVGIIVDSERAEFYGATRSSGRLLSGHITTRQGIVSTVIKESSNGKFLRLENNMLLQFGLYDAYDTGWWLPPYPALIDTNGMYLWNLKNGKKVWIERIL